MAPRLHPLKNLGIRAKLVLLFVLIKVIPLVLLALLAWEGVTHLGRQVAEETDTLTVQVRETVKDMGKTFSKEAERALDNRAREELERLTTDTARAVADFLHDRDQDILLAAQLEPGESAYRNFLASRNRNQPSPGQWESAADGKSWIPVEGHTLPPKQVEASNPENRQDFHYRPPEKVLRNRPVPLFHEITYVGLDGREQLKVSTTPLLPRDLRDVSHKENTYVRAETYFAELKKLKPGELYVSDVIGPYVPSRIIGPVTPERARSLNIPFAPEQEAYAGRENPRGKRFQGIIRWATPVVKNGKVAGYVTLALDHSHIMSFTDNLMPTDARYTPIADAANGNYAFIWDYQDRSIAHPRHHSLVGFDPRTGEYAVPWLDADIYKNWQQSGKPLREYLLGVPLFDHQSREKKPAQALTQAGLLGLECRYLNFAPQCQGWHDLTQYGGSGSFLIQWTGVWKLTTAATIPYYTGHYADTPRGFGYVTIGANIDDFHKPAQTTALQMETRVQEFSERMKNQQTTLRQLIKTSMGNTAAGLAISTLLMIILVVAVAFWLASMLTRRITNLIKGLTRIEGGDYAFRFPHASDDELGRLNDSLNRMADSVQESFRRLEEARIEAEQASHMKSDFLARMSHELRTPLNGILGFSELIKLDAPNNDIREQAETIYQSGDHLLRLVNDILDLARIEAGRMPLEIIPINLSKLLEEVADLHRGAAQQKGLVLSLNLEPKLPDTLLGDPTRLRQVINNLLNNAVKFTTAGQVTLAARVTGERVSIQIRDTGPGIPVECQAIIFEKFRQASSFITREHGGSGLGLALVRELVGLMGGEISLKSIPGAGASFEFWLPLRPALPSTPSN